MTIQSPKHDEYSQFSLLTSCPPTCPCFNNNKGCLKPYRESNECQSSDRGIAKFKTDLKMIEFNSHKRLLHLQKRKQMLDQTCSDPSES
jgi:hypothetical protein